MGVPAIDLTRASRQFSELVDEAARAGEVGGATARHPCFLWFIDDDPRLSRCTLPAGVHC